jgi:hypothetical protein
MVMSVGFDNLKFFDPALGDRSRHQSLTPSVLGYSYPILPSQIFPNDLRLAPGFHLVGNPDKQFSFWLQSMCRLVLEQKYRWRHRSTML